MFNFLNKFDCKPFKISRKLSFSKISGFLHALLPNYIIFVTFYYNFLVTNKYNRSFLDKNSKTPPPPLSSFKKVNFCLFVIISSQALYINKSPCMLSPEDARCKVIMQIKLNNSIV